MTATATENEQRAERAYRAVLAYREEGAEIEEAAIDLMTDILHMLPAYGDPEAAHRIAWHHYVAEMEER